MIMPWEKPPVQDDDLTIPAFLKRDANNVAPWMLNLANNPPKTNPSWLPPWEPNFSSHS
jgi:hypothetical protein